MKPLVRLYQAACLVFIICINGFRLHAPSSIAPLRCTRPVSSTPSVLSMSQPDPSSVKNKSTKRTQRRGRRKVADRIDSSSRPLTSGASAPVSYDPSLENLIQDERKSDLPDLKTRKRGPQTSEAKGEEAETSPGVLLPRQLEEKRRREKAEAAKPNKGAPGYFDTMTKVTWGAIAVLIIAEITVQVIRK